MNQHFTTAVKLVCLTAIIIFAIVRCDGKMELSDAAIKSHAETCTAAGQVQHIVINRTTGIMAECRKP